MTALNFAHHHHVHRFMVVMGERVIVSRHYTINFFLHIFQRLTNLYPVRAARLLRLQQPVAASSRNPAPQKLANPTKSSWAMTLILLQR